MKVTMLDTVEDSNEFTADELKDVPAMTAGTISYRERKSGEKLISVCRVDKLVKGSVYDLPASQANVLKKLGYAE